MAAVVPVLKVVGIALSAKSAIEGIKDGNLFQAVVGAVGAYYGITSLASGAANSAASAASDATQTASTAGAHTVDKVASEIAADKVGGAVAAEAGKAVGAGAELGGTPLESLFKGAAAHSGKPAGEALSSFVAQGGVEAGAQHGGSLMGSINEKISSGAKSLTDVFNGGGEGKGLISGAMDFANKNPAVVQSGLNAFGGVMSGKAEEELMKRQERLLAERRARIGTPGNVARAASMRWNPQTRRFEIGDR